MNRTPRLIPVSARGRVRQVLACGLGSLAAGLLAADAPPPAPPVLDDAPAPPPAADDAPPPTPAFGEAPPPPQPVLDDAPPLSLDDGLGAPPAAASTASGWSWFGRGRLSAGYDSNVLSIPDDIDSDTDEDSSLVAGRADLGLRYQRQAHRLRFGLGGDGTHYFDIDDVDQVRLGANLGYQYVARQVIGHAQLWGNHFEVDGKSVLSDLGGSGGIAQILQIGSHKGVALASLDLAQRNYHQSPDQDGYAVGGKLGYWFVFGRSQRRVEVELKLQRYKADTDAESYWSLRPKLGLRWRWAEALLGRHLDLIAWSSLEVRGYNEADDGVDEAEDSVTLSLGGELSYVWNEHFEFGPYLQGTSRSSNLDHREYDRFRAGIFAGYTW